MDKLIIGLDISQGSAAAFFYRGELPNNLRGFYESSNFARHLRILPQSRRSITLLRRMRPYRVVLETTGRYSIWWRRQLDENGITYEVANQALLAATRRYVAGSDNKDDAFDSLLLVKFFWDKFISDFDRRCWLRKQDSEIVRLRRLLLDVKSCNKKINQTKNSLKANLASEWPEMARISSRIINPSTPDALPAFYAWLAEWKEYGAWELAQHLETRWDRRAEADRAQVSVQTRDLARIVCIFSNQKARLQTEVAELLADERFVPYHRIFDGFAFDVGCRAWLLARIYPFEQFLDADGRAITSYSGSGKTKKHRSKRRFKQVLGLGNSTFQSGQSSSQSKNQGSAEARSALWLYFSRIEFHFDKQGTLYPGRSRAADGPRRRIEEYWLQRAYVRLPSGQLQKRDGKTLIAARNATVRKVAEVLFSALLGAFGA